MSGRTGRQSRRSLQSSRGARGSSSSSSRGRNRGQIAHGGVRQRISVWLLLLVSLSLLLHRCLLFAAVLSLVQMRHESTSQVQSLSLLFCASTAAIVVVFASRGGARHRRGRSSSRRRSDESLEGRADGSSRGWSGLVKMEPRRARLCGRSVATPSRRHGGDTGSSCGRR